jgi:hypothetical protein
MKAAEIRTEPLDEAREVRKERSYTVTANGNVVVNVDRLLRSKRVKEAAAMARRIVELTNRTAK